ncbi:MAG: SPOR domain-containing protein [Candidatus Krumholzibacteriota bacterium]|nr:SPOR domain-containing protein [Candidatus Krumholzibacteriota bacterium]
MDEEHTPEKFEYEKKSNSTINIKKALIWIVPVLVILVVVFMFINYQSGTDDSEYESLISKANKSFRQNEYLKAKKDYEAALLIDPSASHAIERIGVIDSILTFRKEEKIKETLEKEVSPAGEISKESEPEKTEPAEESVEPKVKTPPAGREKYHIVLGCFEKPSNALNYSKKLKGKGYNSKIFPVLDGRMSAVTYQSFGTEKEAFKVLRKVQKEINKEAWVLEYYPENI